MSALDGVQVLIDKAVIGHPPAAGHHHMFGAMSPAQHQGREGIVGAGETCLRERKERQIGLFTHRQLAYIVAIQDLGRALGGPTQSIQMADLIGLITQSANQ